MSLSRWNEKMAKDKMNLNQAVSELNQYVVNLYNGNHEPFQTAGSGRTVKNEFAREIFRQKFGNFLSGNVEKGAQNALEHSKSWRNVRSGAYSKEGYTPNMPDASESPRSASSQAPSGKSSKK